MKYWPRHLEPVLKKSASSFRVVALTGARQTGKSTLLQHAFKKTHRYVSLDSPRDLKLAQDDPETFFRKFPPPLIIDEIQYAPQLLSIIKMAADKSSKRGQFILTGSQQFVFMKGMQETLAGRVSLFELLPMAITEGGTYAQNYEFRGLRGSFPELITQRNLDAQRWYSSYISTYIEKDVQPSFKLEKVAHFRDLLFLLGARCSQVLNYQSLSNDLGVSITAVKLWVRILAISQIIHLLPAYFVNLGSRVLKAPKIYFTDIGLANYLVGNTHKSGLWQGPQAGALFENFVVQETLKHFTNKGARPRLFYFRTNNGLEIDLIVEEKPFHLRPCEIKLTRSPHAGMASGIERFRSLVDGKGRIKVLPGALVSPISHKEPLTSFTTAMNLREFLDLHAQPRSSYI